MFARKIRVDYGSADDWQPAPLKWLDSFAMRSFTNEPIFDDTLPAADGLIEIGRRIPLPRLQAAMEDWFRRKGYIGKNQQLRVTEPSTIRASGDPAIG
jgi:hypothetical protein